MSGAPARRGSPESPQFAARRHVGRIASRSRWQPVRAGRARRTSRRPPAAARGAR